MRGTTKAELTYETVREAVERYLNELAFRSERQQRVTSIREHREESRGGTYSAVASPSFDVVLEEGAPDEPLESQVKRLADFIMTEVPGEPSQSEGAIDTAIRVMRERIQETASGLLRQALASWSSGPIGSVLISASFASRLADEAPSGRDVFFRELHNGTATFSGYRLERDDDDGTQLRGGLFRICGPGKERAVPA